jgi:hypothetical protein
MELSTKNTKTEILEAYETLLKKVETAKSNDPKQVQEENKKKETLEKVSGLNDEKIEKEIVTLKTEMNRSLDTLLKNMTDEFRKLEEIRAAIKLEKKSLEDLYSLSANTDSLAAMLLAQKEKKESFERETKEKEDNFNNEANTQKAQWETEKQRQKASEKEYAEELAKHRKREEEEYQYNRKITRQKEEDEYNSRKISLEKELAEKKAFFDLETARREEAMKNAESELAELRKNNAEFPAKLEKALKDKEKDITASLQIQYGFDTKLIEKQNEAEIRLKDQTITSLQEKIKELQIQVKEYGDKAAKADAGVKEIAVKAIENSKKIQVVTPQSE